MDAKHTAIELLNWVYEPKKRNNYLIEQKKKLIFK